MALAACGAPDGGSARESNTFAAKKGMDAWQIHWRRGDLAATALWVTNALGRIRARGKSKWNVRPCRSDMDDAAHDTVCEVATTCLRSYRCSGFIRFERLSLAKRPRDDAGRR